ncbi:MAG: hypothetical protein DRP65_07955 [Planctomycetota bacterium]|nr:MAG: hypothetical protein DRP65_07955 [Planctomycetota bacterium]
MLCPVCGHDRTIRRMTRKARGEIIRVRWCPMCRAAWTTIEKLCEGEGVDFARCRVVKTDSYDTVIVRVRDGGGEKVVTHETIFGAHAASDARESTIGG